MVDTATERAVLVTVRGRDPQLQKYRAHGFFSCQDGFTTLSASGVLLATGHVICHGSLVAPFIASPRDPHWVAREPLARVTAASSPVSRLLAETTISVTLEQDSATFSCTLVHIGDVPGVQAAVHQLASGSHSEWTVGWPVLLSPMSTAGNTDLRGYAYTSGLCASASLFAVLRMDKGDDDRHVLPSTPLPWISCSAVWRGQPVTVVASPYGMMSHAVFQNSLAHGIVSNTSGSVSRASQNGNPPATTGTAPAVLVTDSRCLPGTEGGLVLNHAGQLVGLVTLPMRPRESATSSINLNLVVSSDALLAWFHSWWKNHVNVTPPPLANPASPVTSLLPRSWLASFTSSGTSKLPRPTAPLTPFHRSAVSNTISKDSHDLVATRQCLSVVERSLVLIRVGSSWASGIVLSDSGFILTNAHLLKPYLQDTDNSKRGGGGSGNRSSTAAPPVLGSGGAGSSKSVRRGYVRAQALSRQLCVHRTGYTSRLGAGASNRQKNSSRVPILRQRAYVRLEPQHVSDSEDASSDARAQLSAVKSRGRWMEAHLVYMSQGPWDLALLQVFVSFPLCPVVPSARPVQRGDKVFVVGHALFGPPAGLSPTVTTGIVAKVTVLDNQPVLIQSSAAVHSGNSGGVLVNEHGSLVGMVTSNVRHSRYDPLLELLNQEYTLAEDVVPSVNFSIPTEALRPLLRFCRHPRHATQLWRDLDAADPRIGKLWDLVPLTEPEDTGPPFPKRFRALVKEMKESQHGTDSQSKQLSSL